MALNQNQQIIELIEKSHSILIAVSAKDLGDGLSGALALSLFLQKLNKPVSILAHTFSIQKLSWLPGTKNTSSDLESLKRFIINLDISKNKISEFNYDIKDEKLKIFITPAKNSFTQNDVSFEDDNYKYDLIFTIGSQDLESIGDNYRNNSDFFYNTTIINIDTDSSNEHFGQLNYVNLNHSSCSESIFNFLHNTNKDVIDDDIANCLLTGIIIKTNSFRTPLTSPQTLNIASYLIKHGADRNKILMNLSQNKKLSTLNLWGRVLARLKQDTHYKLAWSLISQSDFKKSGATPDQLSGLVGELISNSPLVEVTLFLYETGKGTIAGELHTAKNYDSLELTREFNPEGDKDKATFSTSHTNIIEAENEIINKLRSRIQS